MSILPPAAPDAQPPRPIASIDPEDTEAVERLVALITKHQLSIIGPFAEDVRAALREYAASQEATSVTNEGAS